MLSYNPQIYPQSDLPKRNVGQFWLLGKCCRRDSLRNWSSAWALLLGENQQGGEESDHRMSLFSKQMFSQYLAHFCRTRTLLSSGRAEWP